MASTNTKAHCRPFPARAKAEHEHAFVIKPITFERREFLCSQAKKRKKRGRWRRKGEKTTIKRVRGRENLRHMKGGDTKKRKTKKGKTKENKSAARLLTATIPAAADGVIAGITKLEPSHAHRVRVMQPGSRGDLVPGSNRHHHTGATSSAPPPPPPPPPLPPPRASCSAVVPLSSLQLSLTYTDDRFPAFSRSALSSSITFRTTNFQQAKPRSG